MAMITFKRIIVIGCGGTGSFLIPALARYLKSQNFLGELCLIDGDFYSESNSERQMFKTSGLNTNKAEYQTDQIVNSLPEYSYELNYIDAYVGEEELDELIVEHTMVINCADNHAVRNFAEQALLKRNNGVHICCGNEMVMGQVQISMRSDGQQILPSIFTRFPEIKTTKEDRAKMSCEELQKLPSGGQVISANMTAATLAMNAIIACLSPSKAYGHGSRINFGTIQFVTNGNDFVKLDVLAPL
jgi:molybdopterin/thiamine biosynthesis adenylyltransferase